jgi:hypothetical protein
MVKKYLSLSYGKQMIIYLISVAPLTIIFQLIYHILNSIEKAPLGVTIFTIYYGSTLWYGCYLNGKWANEVMKKQLEKEQGY